MSNLLESTKRYLENACQQPALYTMTPDEVRKLRANAPKVNLLNQPPLNNIQDVTITVRDGGEIPLRIYTPNGNGPFPIIIYFHGGGWVLNDIETCDATCKILAAETSSIVISVGYRLAPEYQFPVPVHDAYDALSWIFDHSQELNGLLNNITVMGDSAGGNLATVVAIMNQQSDGPSLKAQVLLYPVADLSFDTSSYLEFQEGYGLQKKDMEWFASYYLQEKELYNHPHVAPLKAKNLTNLPDAYIIVAENDVLKDEGIAYAKKLREAGNRVELQIANGLVHSFFTKNEYFHKEIEKTIKSIRNFLINN